MIFRFCVTQKIEIQKGYTCGSYCSDYKPRNKKCGICKYSRKFKFSDREAKEKILTLLNS
jgi:hypothetical protein